MCCLPTLSWKPRPDARPSAWQICSNFENGWIVIWPRVRARTMCKENYASYVIINMPQGDIDECALWPAFCDAVALSTHIVLVSWLIFSLTFLLWRRIYHYSLPGKIPDAQAPEARCQDSGTGPQRNPQPASRG